MSTSAPPPTYTHASSRSSATAGRGRYCPSVEHGASVHSGPERAQPFVRRVRCVRLLLQHHTTSTDHDGRRSSWRGGTAWDTNFAGAVRRCSARTPQLGRPFAPGDERPERNSLIILSDRSWRTHYGSDPGLLGSSLTIDGRPYTLIGIMPPGFAFPDAQTDFWIPLTSAPVPPPSEPRSDSPNSAYADGVFARLRDGVAIEAASAEADAILRDTRVSSERRRRGRSGGDRLSAKSRTRAEVVSMKDELVAPVRPTLQMLSFAAVLLAAPIACANLVSLFLERVESEAPTGWPFGPLWAPARQQILRQFAIEGVVLAVAGGAIGIAARILDCTTDCRWSCPPDGPRELTRSPSTCRCCCS